jgi:hypothetical protein
MAAIASFGINVKLSGSVTNPINTTYYQVVAPWGQTSQRATLREALHDIADRCGAEQGGVMGNYLNFQTLNGASGSGATTYLTANEIGIP